MGRPRSSGVDGSWTDLDPNGGALMSWHTARDRAFYVYDAQDEFICNARNEKTAREIAALPDLLTALRRMLREHNAITIASGGMPGETDRWPEAAAAARAAIAKATGEAA